MRGMKFGLMVLAATLLIFALGGLAYAFHTGGVAECTGCHSMHSPKDLATGALLIATDPSSVCLSCHQQTGLANPSSYHVSTAETDMPTGVPPKQRTPGGDFGWLKKTYTYVVRSSTTVENGQTHGHNINAADFNYVTDTDNPTAPGGSFPSNQLGCPSCHDQHGNYRRLPNGTVSTQGGPIIASGSYNTSPGNSAANPIPAGQAVGVFRLLRGNGSTVQNVTFGGVPAAVAPSTYNQTENPNQVRVAYGVATAGGHESWGQWCATCHPAMHSNGNYVHPVDTTLSPTLVTNYNSYVSSGNLSGSFQAGQGPFLSLVPFMSNTGDYTVLGGLASNNPSGAQLNGPQAGDQVSCPSCHRAHATEWPDMLRWNMGAEFITYVNAAGAAVWPGTDTTPSAPQYAAGRNSTETAAGYYDRLVTVFGPYQRMLCNKCHAQD